MDLQEKIKEVKSFGNNLRIVEFDNDFAVAYEKQNIKGWEALELVDGTIEEQFIIKAETFVGYAVLPQKKVSSYSMQGINQEKNVSFSCSAKKTIENYLRKQNLNDGSNERSLKQESLDNDIKSLYEKIFSQFNIKEIGDRNWETIGFDSLFCFGWPIFFPCALVYSIFKREEDSIKMAAYSFFGSLLLPSIIMELVSPDYTKKKIKNRKIISKEKYKGPNIALDFYSGNPKNFHDINFIFQNGLELNPWGKLSEGKLKNFENANYYIKSNDIIENEINKIKREKHEIRKEIKDVYNRKKRFEEILAESDQTGILERIGF
ncbi:MAG: hypothetical protein KJ939_02760 [Nanoarchaeota archaeon]|nr:hypothetical protein [Nanoarchaeota archaeon]